MTNSLQLYKDTIQKGLRERQEAHQTALTRAEIIQEAWKNLKDALRQSTGIDDLDICPFVNSFYRCMPVTGDLVRLRFPALEEVTGYIPEIICSIQAVVSSRTGEVITAKPNRFWYVDNGETGRMIQSPDLMSALFNTLEVPEIPEEELVGNLNT